MIVAKICLSIAWKHGFETHTGSYDPTGLTKNRSAIQFFKLIKPKIWLLLNRMNHRQTAWASKLATGLRVGNTFYSNIFKKKKKNCQPCLLTNLTPFLCCKQLTIARSWYWSEGSLTLVVLFVVKRERERERRKEKSESITRSRWVLIFILGKNA